ncbi:DUF4083 domain-containing protein [Margalitia sp. FSL K6-0131]|uniref:DUF4083 domain-containing protein n=1 Tax=Margalitia sp. FSL K6-0131 TaxID=2954604 RepID=UPI0030FBC0F4
MHGHLNTGDIIFQLFTFCIPIVFLVFIISFIVSNKKRKKQLKRIEEKLDLLQNKDSLE